uniref:Uncharacterized protein n=1 Tax=Aegilops tauschii subsp. strangulata TaxID=200361 RepID=A0A453BCZ4_AEGTS
ALCSCRVAPIRVYDSLSEMVNTPVEPEKVLAMDV